MTDITSFDTLADELLAKHTLIDESLFLQIGRCVIKVSANNFAHLAQLKKYFTHVHASDAVCAANNADMHIVALQSEPLVLYLPFKDWRREGGKVGRKDAYYDFDAARILFKVRTGMVFLQSLTTRIAVGPCLANDNQVINFVNSQYMSWLQNTGWQTCHAAGLVKGDIAIAMAGFSGGGKSTLMLHLLEDESLKYLTNDRLLIGKSENGIEAAGIPKLPRINPGTIVNNERLLSLISEEEKQAFLAMDKNELWELEQKYDVMISDLYGENRIATIGKLKHFIVLNWHRNSDEPTELKPIDITKRSDLLAAVMKSPGPFFQFSDGTFYRDDITLDEAKYLEHLEGVTMYEATGRADFIKMSQLCKPLFS
ncbi:HprK-related kinase B [Algibacillus agarilyticus]|uniref:HprK-related kinase B n=1 Tax=Algibacillus agarilyticus TaxID=2234133 RepID=UPI000DD01BB0|nr:HprK-related kinase B [Algibacillus agarilyticus]